MIVGTVKETFPEERRVALVPVVVPILAKAGFETVVEAGAGVAAGFPDGAYEAQGARVVSDRAAVLRSAEIVVQVRGYGANPERGRADLEHLRSGQVLLGLFEPLGAPAAVSEVARRGVTLFALEMVPRITRAQSMDVLSSMATVAGYKAVLLAATHLPKMFPMLMTAAGTITPAKVFVIGVGVAGLQAIATARRLGGLVEAYDVRPAVKEQVQSLGAKFVEMDIDTAGAEAEGGYAKALGEGFYARQRELLKRVLADKHVVITTAAVPGKKAPVLVTTEMIEGMSRGAVIVDLAAERGGNCEPTRPDEIVEHHGVTILGPVNLAASVPADASQMYARNVTALLRTMIQDGKLHIDLADEIHRETIVAHGGEVVHPRVREALGLEGAPAGAGVRSGA